MLVVKGIHHALINVITSKLQIPHSHVTCSMVILILAVLDNGRKHATLRLDVLCKYSQITNNGEDW